MKKIIGFVLLLSAIVLFLVAAFDSRRTMSIKRLAKQVKVGDSKQSVRKSLGDPDGIYQPSEKLIAEAHTNWIAAFFTVGRETWAYGRRLDFKHAFSREFPYFYPVRIRMFRPDSEDLSIEFDLSGKVVKVTGP
jgi:hypothetical protein